MRACRVGENEYNLYLNADIGTFKHQSWFYFQISNVKKKTIYKFNINNLANSDN